MNWLGLSDTLWALIVVYPTFLVPFCTWLLMDTSHVPKEIEECAMLDGCSRLQSMLFILLPAAVPGVICAALFAFTLSWNEFLYSLVFVSPAELKTMTVAFSPNSFAVTSTTGVADGRSHDWLAPDRCRLRLLP